MPSGYGLGIFGLASKKDDLRVQDVDSEYGDHLTPRSLDFSAPHTPTSSSAAHNMGDDLHDDPLKNSSFSMVRFATR
jgi:hypothetical protein